VQQSQRQLGAAGCLAMQMATKLALVQKAIQTQQLAQEPKAIQTQPMDAEPKAIQTQQLDEAPKAWNAVLTAPRPTIHCLSLTCWKQLVGTSDNSKEHNFNHYGYVLHT
jgi:hypothetical protein